MDNPLFENVDRYISELPAPEDQALINTGTLLKEEGIPTILQTVGVKEYDGNAIAPVNHS